MLTVQEVQAVFFKAMQHGWAAGAAKTSIAELPGFKVILWEEGNWRVVDAYIVGENGKSSGFTTIFHKDALAWIAVWIMYYGGSYQERAILFLKRALLEAYQAQAFLGGRGPIRYQEGQLVYFNRRARKNFRSFKGKERAWNLSTNEFLGSHEYWGMALVPLKR